MIELVPQPLSLFLTKTYLEQKGFPVLYGGAYWRFRVHLIDSVTGAGKDLTGSLCVWKWVFGGTSITRRSDITSATAPTTQIVLDDQTSEDTAAATGRGWLTVYCYAVAAEVAEFAPMLAGVNVEQFVRSDFELAIRFGGAVIQHPVLAGKQDIYKPRNTFPLS